MMKKTKLAVLVSALVWGAAAGTATAAPVAVDQQLARAPGVWLATVEESWNATPGFNSAFPATDVLARKGRKGADDPPEPCDDHGTDLCRTGATSIAKHGADNPPEPCDDHGTDLCLTGTTTISTHGPVVVQREVGEGPRGGDNERPGDRRRRGGKGLIDDGRIDLAREAGEGPRGGDKERPGDRRRRGGKGLIDDGNIELARGSSSSNA